MSGYGNSKQHNSNVLNVSDDTPEVALSNVV